MPEKCAHGACFCEATDDDYCGTHCAEAAVGDQKGPTCECGHIDCEEATMRIGGVHPTGGGAT